MLLLYLDRLDEPLQSRLYAYAEAHEIRTPDAAARLLTIALDHLEARRAGALAANSHRTPEERAALGRHAVRQRKTHPVAHE